LRSSFPLRFKTRRAEGGVDIRVESVTLAGLAGKKRVWFRGIVHLIGILGESRFVSELRKAESAQHSPAERNLRRAVDRWVRAFFRHFLRLGLFLIARRSAAHRSASK
jgi:hypothetical protein